ncbi:MAG: GNAT family N-acetyltransferase [Gammaproteobacteria bacterium]|jgi:ribosomal protein S18 acetylase RimI-like enzyme
MRTATVDDVEYIASAMIRIPAHISQSDPYVDGLPKAVTNSERDYVRAHIADADSIVLVEESSKRTVGCLVGLIAETSFPPSALGKVGHISVVWVEPESRGKGIAGTLIDAAQSWFRNAGLRHMELSYMANNALASQAWARMGFRPFRTFAYKTISVERED